MGRYYVVSTDDADRVIRSGSHEWDGTTAVDLPPGTRFISEQAALDGGYQPPAPSAEELNYAALRERAVTALRRNATFMALPTPRTNAQNAAQVELLTRECSGVIRLALGLLDSTEGT